VVEQKASIKQCKAVMEQKASAKQVQELTVAVGQLAAAQKANVEHLESLKQKVAEGPSKLQLEEIRANVEQKASIKQYKAVMEQKASAKQVEELTVAVGQRASVESFEDLKRKIYVDINKRFEGLTADLEHMASIKQVDDLNASIKQMEDFHAFVEQMATIKDVEEIRAAVEQKPDIEKLWEIQEATVRTTFSQMRNVQTDIEHKLAQQKLQAHGELKSIAKNSMDKLQDFRKRYGAGVDMHDPPSTGKPLEVVSPRRARGHHLADDRSDDSQGSARSASTRASTCTGPSTSPIPGLRSPIALFR